VPQELKNSEAVIKGEATKMQLRENSEKNCFLVNDFLLYGVFCFRLVNII
jgi:hypothetical protein